MRIGLVITGVAVILMAGTGAAYAVVGNATVSPTVSGNVLPIDDNHSPDARQTEPGDDHGGLAPAVGSPTTEPGDDRGGLSPEPGDDRGGLTPEPGDDRGGVTPEPGDDRNRGQATDDTISVTGSTSERGNDDSAAHATAGPAGSSKSGSGSDDGPRGDGSGRGHH
jgi:hypothetical protein